MAMSLVMAPPHLQSNSRPCFPPPPATAQEVHPVAAAAGSSAENDDEGMYASEDMGEEVKPRGEVELLRL